MIKDEERAAAEDEKEWEQTIAEANFEKAVHEVLIETMYSTKGRIVYSEVARDSADFLFIRSAVLGGNKSKPSSAGSAKIIGAMLIRCEDCGDAPESAGPSDSSSFVYAPVTQEELHDFLLTRGKDAVLSKDTTELLVGINGPNLVAICRPLPEVLEKSYTRHNRKTWGATYMRSR